MFTDEPLDEFKVESFDLDPVCIAIHKLRDASISGKGLDVLVSVVFYLFDVSDRNA